MYYTETVRRESLVSRGGGKVYYTETVRRESLVSRGVVKCIILKLSDVRA